MSLSRPAPPALVAGCLAYSFEMGCRCCVSRQKLVVAASQLLSHSSGFLAHLTSRGGAVSVPPLDVCPDPAAGLEGSGLGSLSGEMCQAGLSEVGRVCLCQLACCCLPSQSICSLVSCNSPVGWCPADGDVVAPGSELSGYLDCCPGESLGRSALLVK